MQKFTHTKKTQENLTIEKRVQDKDGATQGDNNGTYPFLCIPCTNSHHEKKANKVLML